MNNGKVINFFRKYEKACVEFSNGSVHIPYPDPKNGEPGKDIILMFINERPGRVGPGKSGIISFENSDPTANWFRKLFGTLDINRGKIFITNACIFYPDKNNYFDKSPNTKEIKFSIPILADQILRVNPKIIVTMGNTALNAVKRVFLKSVNLKTFRLKNHIGNSISDMRPYVFPLYHTSLRSRVTRNKKQQQKDWAKLKKFIRTI